jgi:monofunctional biosynthetic peptidoglycan transglycosylase
MEPVAGDEVVGRPASPAASLNAALAEPAGGQEVGGDRPAAPLAPRRARRRWVGLALGVLVVWLGWTVASWPDVARLARENPKSTAFIARYEERRAQALRAAEERRGAAATGAGTAVRVPPALAWRPVAYAAIAPTLKQAVVVAEDIDFFSHSGFATAEIRAALRDAWEDKELPRGASTLTQQLAKNLWLTPSYNPLRKLREALLTWQLERDLSKRRILELYLNVVEFGPGVYGAEAAARRYFGVSAAGLGPRQAAELAAALPRPASWHPGVTSTGYLRHVERIEARMAKAQWVLGEL